LLIFTFIALILGFVSYAWINNGQHTAGNGMMKNFWSLWQPSFNISIGYSKIFVYLQFLPYIFSMFYFVRHVKIFTPEFNIFLILSIAYSVIYAEPRFREPFMPFLILFVAKPLGIFIKNINMSGKLNYIYNYVVKTGKIIPIPELSRSLKPVSLSLIITLLKTLLIKS